MSQKYITKRQPTFFPREAEITLEQLKEVFTEKAIKNMIEDGFLEVADECVKFDPKRFKDIKIIDPTENFKMITVTSDGKEFTNELEAILHQNEIISERRYQFELENRSWIRKLLNLDPK